MEFSSTVINSGMGVGWDLFMWRIRSLPGVIKGCCVRILELGPLIGESTVFNLFPTNIPLIMNKHFLGHSNTIMHTYMTLQRKIKKSQNNLQS